MNKLREVKKADEKEIVLRIWIEVQFLRIRIGGKFTKLHKVPNVSRSHRISLLQDTCKKVLNKDLEENINGSTPEQLTRCWEKVEEGT